MRKVTKILGKVLSAAVLLLIVLPLALSLLLSINAVQNFVVGRAAQFASRKLETVVHQQKTANNGEIVVALLGEEATVKRLQRRGGEVWLLPENENYQPIDGREAVLMGRVDAVIRRY